MSQETGHLNLKELPFVSSKRDKHVYITNNEVLYGLVNAFNFSENDDGF